MKAIKNRDKNKIHARESSDFISLIFSRKNTLIIYFVNLNQINVNFSLFWGCPNKRLIRIRCNSGALNPAAGTIKAKNSL